MSEPQHATDDDRSRPTPDRRRRAAQLTRLLQRITVLANEAGDTATALERAVADIAETMGWPAGRAMEVDSGPSLREVGQTFVAQGHEDASAAVELLGTSGAMEEIALQAVHSEVARWRPLVADPGGNGNRRGSLAFPVVANGDAVAVLQFVSANRADPDEDLLRTMADVGRQLGILVERNHAIERLEELNTELERSNRQLERFAYVASHDLQEPLRKIIGFTELLELRHGDELSEQASEYFGIVTDGARRMRQLLEDLLAYSRAGRRELEMQAVDLTDLVETVLADLEPAAKEAGATIEIETPLPTVHGDARELRSVFLNLVGNALKYHREDQPPTVTISAVPESEGWWRVTVADDGIGIAPEHHERVFEIFQRLHARGEFGGTGIGLALCEQAVAHHGGRIWIESEPGQGSRFHVSLPDAHARDG